MIKLSDAIEALREELAHSFEIGKTKDIQFLLEEATIEFQLVAENTVSGEAKVNWWILSGGAGTTTSEKSSHMLTVKLRPIDKGGQALKVSDKREGPIG